MKISSFKFKYLPVGSLTILDLNESVLSLLLIPVGSGLHFTFPWVIWSKTVTYLITASELVFKDLLKVYVNFQSVV